IQSLLAPVTTKLETNAHLLSRIINKQNLDATEKVLENINLAEYKVYSQWGDDGIIQFLVNYLDIDSEIFVEFGVEDYTESNTRFLLINNNWSGLIFDGSSQ